MSNETLRAVEHDYSVPDKSNLRDPHFEAEDLHGTYNYLKRNVMNAKLFFRSA